MTSDSKSRQSKGFFNKLKARLNRGTSWLKDDLLGRMRGRLDGATIEALEEQLLLSDVGVECTEWLIKRMQTRRAEAADDSAVARLRATILELLTPLEVPLECKAAEPPFLIMAVGVNGTGKTTSVGKLAYRLKLAGHSVLLAAADTFRAAAVEQLQEWGQRAGVPVIAQAEGADPAAVVHDALASARARGSDVLLADTAGRLHTAADLMAELAKIKRVAARFSADAPHEVLLVLDASQGQNALAQAVKFHERLGVTGLVLTKLDGTAKGGIVLAIARKLSLPIRFIAVGEAIEDFEVFRAADFTAALLGDVTQ